MILWLLIQRYNWSNILIFQSWFAILVFFNSVLNEIIFVLINKFGQLLGLRGVWRFFLWYTSLSHLWITNTWIWSNWLLLHYNFCIFYCLLLQFLIKYLPFVYGDLFGLKIYTVFAYIIAMYRINFVINLIFLNSKKITLIFVFLFYLSRLIQRFVLSNFIFIWNSINFRWICRSSLRHLFLFIEISWFFGWVDWISYIFIFVRFKMSSVWSSSRFSIFLFF